MTRGVNKTSYGPCLPRQRVFSFLIPQPDTGMNTKSILELIMGL